MSGEVVSLAGARVDRHARVHASIDKAVAKAGADFGRWGEALIEWTLKVAPEQKAQLAEALASEIVTRYAPIAKQFRALYDVVELYLAAAQERGESLDVGLLRALTIMMGDERYIGLARHVAREQAIAAKDGMTAEIAQSIRHNSPSVIDAARDRIFDHYVGLRKK